MSNTVEHLRSQLDAANEIIIAVMREVPAGYTPAHTPENLPDRVRDLVVRYAQTDRLEAERDAANAELAAMKAQLENVLDSHREGTWMARALDAERELAALRAQAQQADELRDILSRILELSDDCTVRGLKAALRAKLQAGVSPPNASNQRPSEARSDASRLLGGEGTP